VDYLEVDVSGLDIGGLGSYQGHPVPAGYPMPGRWGTDFAVVNAPSAAAEKVEEEVKEEGEKGSRRGSSPGGSTL